MVSCVDENELTKEARDIYMLVYRKVQTTGQRNFEEVNQSTENRGRGDAAPRQSRQRSSEEVNQSTENCVRRDVAPRHSRQRNSEEANQSTENRGRRYIAPRRSRQRNSEEANQSTENRGRRDAAPRQSRVFGEIRYYQRHIGFLLPIAPFQRMVRKIGHKYNKRLRYQPESLLALQEAAEAHLVGLFEDGTRCAVHAKRVTLMTRDLDLVKDLKR